MRKLKTYEKHVKEKYPDAHIDEFIRLETLYNIKTKKSYIGEWEYTPGAAWESAYRKTKTV